MTGPASKSTRASHPEPNYSHIGFQFLREEPKQAGRAVAWLRGHKHFLPLASIGIVFFTFLVKEGLEQRLKGLEDSIASAQGVYLLRKDIDDLRFRLIDIATKLKLTQPEISLIHRTDVDEYLADDIGSATMEIMLPLSEKLNNPALRRRILRIENKRQQLSDDAFHLAMLPASDDDNNNPDFLDDEQTRIDAELETLHSRMTKVADDLVEESIKQKEQAERECKIWTWASYFLYTIGLGLGLIGQLEGIKAGKED